MECADELWSDIPGCGGLYQASTLGRARSVSRGIILSPCLLKGYRAVNVKLEGRKKLITIHRLVLMAFVGMPAPGQEARHKNGDKLDNRLVNLEWSTHLDNMHDRYVHGTYGIGRVVSDATCRKISASKIGHTVSQECRDKIRAKLIGIKQSPETRAKKSEAQKLRWAKRRSRAAVATEE